MLSKLKKSKSEGFTIIEVMIVLAIAGLILLIVFLAIPALQRNSRNTQRKTDIGRVGSAIQNVLSNNNGSVASITNANIQADLTTLSYYTTANVTTAAATPAATNTTNVDQVHVSPGAICAALPGGGGGNGQTSAGATTRSVAVTYSVETGGGTTKNCSDE